MLTQDHPILKALMEAQKHIDLSIIRFVRREAVDLNEIAKALNLLSLAYARAEKEQNDAV